MYSRFGDKQRLFRAILEEATVALKRLAQTVLAQYLDGQTAITGNAELEAALSSIAVNLGNAVGGSTEYAAALALSAQRRWQDPAPEDDVATAAVELAFAERIAHFSELGLLEVDDPRLSADHFFALTILLASNEQPNPLTVDSARVRRTGVHAFVHAYELR